MKISKLAESYERGNKTHDEWKRQMEKRRALGERLLKVSWKKDIND